MLRKNAGCHAVIIHEFHAMRYPSHGTRRAFSVSIAADAFLAGRTSSFTRGATMFEDSLVESAALLGKRSRWPALLAFTTQCAVAVIIISLPLLHPEMLPTHRILPATLAPPRPPAPPPPQIHVRPQLSNAATTAPSAPASVQPTQIFQSFLHPTGPTVEAPPIGIVDLGGKDPALPPGINTAAPASPHVTIAPAAARAPSKPVSISSGVSAGNLIAPIRPEYPQIARITHTEGTVVIEAIISRTGSIESAQVVSGPPMLQQAALAAVREARYRPFRLNGQPTEVQTTITVVFKMSS
jgi:protein TonB